MTNYIADIAHYNEVLARVASVRHSLVIGTADIKDLYVKVGAGREPFLAVLDILVRRGVEVRLLHAKEPGLISVRTSISILLSLRSCNANSVRESISR